MTYSRSHSYQVTKPGLEFSSSNSEFNMFPSWCLSRVGLLVLKEQICYRLKTTVFLFFLFLCLLFFLCLSCSSIFLIYYRSLCLAFSNEGFGWRHSKTSLGNDPFFLNCRETLHYSHYSDLSWKHRGGWNPELHF